MHNRLLLCEFLANTAAMVGGVLWFGTYAPFMIFQPKYSSMTNRQILASTIFPNTALGYIFQSLIMFEGIGTGLSWQNLSVTVSPDDKMCIAHIMIMLAIDTFLYGLIAVYLETAFPQNSGYHPVWYFFILVIRSIQLNTYIFLNRTYSIIHYSPLFGSDKKSIQKMIMINLASRSNHSARVSPLANWWSTIFPWICIQIK